MDICWIYVSILTNYNVFLKLLLHMFMIKYSTVSKYLLLNFLEIQMGRIVEIIK